MSVNFSNVTGFERYRRQVAEEAKLEKIELEQLAAEKAAFKLSTASEPPGPFDGVPAPGDEAESEPAPQASKLKTKPKAGDKE